MQVDSTFLPQFSPAATVASQPEAVEDPFDSAEYHEFLASMAQYCHCTSPYNPCDRVLAGGPCDHRRSFDIDDELLTADDHDSDNYDF